MELYEDGFIDKDKQIKILYEKGKNVKEIAEEVGVTIERINEVIKNNEDKNNLNE